MTVESIGLAEAFASAQPRPNGRIDKILADLPPEDAAAFRQALSDQSGPDEFRIPAPTLAKILTGKGFALSVDSVHRYRRKMLA